MPSAEIKTLEFNQYQNEQAMGIINIKRKNMKLLSNEQQKSYENTVKHAKSKKIV